MNIPQGPLNSGSGKLWRENQTKPFHQAIFDLPLGSVLIFVVPCVTLYAIFSGSMPCNIVCSHLINKVNRYLKQSEPCLCTHVHFHSLMWKWYKKTKNMRKEGGKKKLPHTSHSVWSLLQTDSKNYCYVVWFKTVSISSPLDSHFPHSQPSPPTQALLFEWSLSDG